MKLLIVGGKLQGTEACYLAGKAGYETVLVDRREAPPAAGLADQHVVTDITADEARARALVTACDAVLPACEDLATLEWLEQRTPAWGVPLLFDLPAYRVSESKLASRSLFAELDVPRPAPWPGCEFPVVVKPSSASGSEGVCVAAGEQELEAARQRLLAAGHEVVIEEYVPGPSLSLEVLAWGGRAMPLQVTGLEFDAVYDCKRVVAPVGEWQADEWQAGRRHGDKLDWAAAVPAGTLAAFDAVATRLAQGLELNGLTDVEVMVRGGTPMVLEIDARLPSQTPTVVYWSSGINIVAALLQTAARGALPEVDREPRRACVYEHVSAHDGVLEITGEHVMASAQPLQIVPGFYGVDEALTDYRHGSRRWSATLIAAATTVAEARASIDAAVAAMARLERLRHQPEVDRACEEVPRP
jgi:3-methylornithine--L-lysine ligase